MRTRSSRARKCPICGVSARKHGRTKSGGQRWRCTDCEVTFTARRPDLVARSQFKGFLGYVTGKLGVEEVAARDGVSPRSWRRDHAWCWTVPTPKPPATGQIHDQLFLDGIHLAHGWVLLTAVNQDGIVVAWQWAISENAAAYRALLKDLPPPRLVTVDGAGGALKAIQEVWEPDDGVLVQRCLIHVHRNNRVDLTSNPKTQAGQALLHLSHRLLRITTIDQARDWEVGLATFHQVYGDWLKERTYASDDPQGAAQRGRTWWYTHERDRRVYFRLTRLMRSTTLFNYLHPTFDFPAANTTNTVESINAQIRLVFLHHRGLNEPHALTAAEWALYARTAQPKGHAHLYQEWEKTGHPQRAILPQKARTRTASTSPQKWGTATSNEEGLWPRKGWAGRYKP